MFYDIHWLHLLTKIKSQSRSSSILNHTDHQTQDIQNFEYIIVLRLNRSIDVNEV